METKDAAGRPYTQAEIRRMKRRITNRESARRMRLKRQEEWNIAKNQHRTLRDERAKLMAVVGDAQAAAAAAADDARRWQALWRSAAASNLELSRRVAELGGEAGPDGLSGGVVGAPTLPPAGSLDGGVPALLTGAPAGLLRGLSGLAAALMASPRGDGRPSSAGTPRSDRGGRRRTNPGALAGPGADLAAAGRASTAALPLSDDVLRSAGVALDGGAGGFGGAFL